MPDAQRALDAQKKIEEAKYEEASIQGKIEEVTKQLKELAEVSTVEEAKTVLEVLAKKIEENKKEIEQHEKWLEDNCDWF